MSLTNPLEKAVFRTLEKLTIKKTKTRSRCSFNNACLTNNLLPKYTNIRINDPAAQNAEFVLEFKRNLIRQNLTEANEELLSIESMIENQWLLMNNSTFETVQAMKTCVLEIENHKQHTELTLWKKRCLELWKN